MTIEAYLYQKIRHMYQSQRLSQRQIANRLNISRKTVAKYCRGMVLPDVRKTPEREAALYEAVKPIIIRLLKENRSLPPKQMWRASTIWQYLLEKEGIAIAESTVRQYVRMLRLAHPEIFVPLVHDPGAAMQFDWGDMAAIIGGERIVTSVFCDALPHSGAICAWAYPNKKMLSFLDGHIRSFEWFGGVPKTCVYDNLRTAVKEGSGKHAVKTQDFKRLEAHYAFEAVFCNIASGWEKSNVENAVAIVRRIAFTPMPRVDDFQQLQEHISNKCLEYNQTHHIRGHSDPIRVGLARDIAALMPLPGLPLDMGFTEPALVHKDLTVRYDNTRYSVPAELAGKEVTLRIYPFQLAICYKGKEVYRHKRPLGKDEHQYVLEHYLEVLVEKPRAVDQALPLRTGIMPDECKQFLKLCTEKDARHQLVQILLLGQKIEREELLWAIQQANNTRFPSYKLVRTFLEIARTEPDLSGPEIFDPVFESYNSLLNQNKEEGSHD